MYNVAVIGATGLVGSKVIEAMEGMEVQVNNFYPVASPNSSGKKVKFRGREFPVITFQELPKEKVQIAFNAVNSSASQSIIPELLKLDGLVVIDKSSGSRMDPKVPLIVSGVNEHTVQLGQKLIALPNCCVIPLVLALNPLNALYKIRRIVLSTYQSASGAGNAQMQKLWQDTKDDLTLWASDVHSRLAFNVLPWIGGEERDGHTGEEVKICQEVKKILQGEVKISATSVRVPVAVGHCICANVEFEVPVCPRKAGQTLETAGCIVSKTYLTPREVAGSTKVFVSRIRVDPDLHNALNMWIVADNLLRGAATNAVEVCASMIERRLIRNS